MKVSWNMYEQGDDVLLAACDEDLVGSTLKDEELQLKVKEDFYGGNLLDIEAEEKTLRKKFNKATIGNLVGEKIVNAAIDAGFGNEGDIMRIDGVPHLQIVRF